MTCGQDRLSFLKSVLYKIAANIFFPPYGYNTKSFSPSSQWEIQSIKDRQ